MFESEPLCDEFLVLRRNDGVSKVNASWIDSYNKFNVVLIIQIKSWKVTSATPYQNFIQKDQPFATKIFLQTEKSLIDQISDTPKRSRKCHSPKLLLVLQTGSNDAKTRQHVVGAISKAAKRMAKADGHPINNLNYNGVLVVPKYYEKAKYLETGPNIQSWSYWS